MKNYVDILIIGSGFGGAVAARRLAAAGHDVMMLERGPWRDTVPNRSAGLGDLAPLPQGWKALTHGFRSVRSHAFKGELVLNRKGFAEAYFGNGITVVCSSGVGGGSHIYAGLLGRPSSPTYWDNRHPQISQARMNRYYDEIVSLFGARPLTTRDKVPNLLAETGYGGTLANLGGEGLPVGVLFPSIPGAPARVTDRHGIERWECDMRNNSFMGSPSGAKTTLDFAFVIPAMRDGLVVRDMCEATSIRRLDNERNTETGAMRYEVRYRNHRSGQLESIHARHVILAAGGLNTVRLLLKSRDVDGGLAGMPRLGHRFGGNGDFFGFWKENSPRDLSAGLPICGPFRWRHSQNRTVLVLRSGLQGVDRLPVPSPLKKWLRRQSVIIAFGGDTDDGVMTMPRGVYKIRYDTAANPLYREIDSEVRNIELATGTRTYAPKTPVTVHPIGGACLGTSPHDGVVGANGEVFGHPGLYVADAAALPASPGGAPSLSIAAWSAHVADRLIEALQPNTEPAGVHA